MRITERVYLDSPPKIDAESGTLTGVKLLGANSKNNRRYTRECMSEAARLYKGQKVYVDHPARDDGDRSIDRWVGTIQDARFESDGIYGDVKLRRKSPFFEGIIEAAGDFPKDIGFSHVADGKTKMDGETEIVESIREVFSVDLVASPATTAGFWESETMQKTITKTLKEIAEAAPKDDAWGKVLLEAVTAGAVPADMAMETTEEADPSEEVRLALEKAAVAVIRKMFAGDVDPSAGFSEIRRILSLKDKAAPKEGDGGGDKPPEPPKSESVLLARIAKLEAKNLLLESGREATEPRIKALAAASEGDRAELLESWPKTGEAEITESIERPRRSPPLIESACELTWETPEQLGSLLGGRR